LFLDLKIRKNCTGQHTQILGKHRVSSLGISEQYLLDREFRTIESCRSHQELERGKHEFEAAGLREGVYSVKVVEIPDMLVIVDKSNVFVRFYSEKGELYADVPDDVVNKLKHGKGEELEVLLLGDMKRRGIAFIIL